MNYLKKILVIYWILLLQIPLKAQDGWFYQTPVHVKDMQFINIDKCVAVGEGVWISSDAGNSWQGYYPDFVITGQAYLESVHFPNFYYGFAVGNNGLFIKTANGGTIWERISIPLSYPNTLSFNDVYFVNDDVGCIVGYTFDNGYLGYILKTTDGGRIWRLVHEGAPLLAVDFSDRDIGWASGFNGSLYKSTDLGDSWTQVSLPPLPDSTAMPNLVDVEFTDVDHGIIAMGNFKYVLTTGDGGINWQIVETGISGYYNHIQYFNDGFAYTIVDYPSQYSGVYRSHNSGNAWSLVYESGEELGANGLPRSFTFANEAVGIAYGDAQFLTKDAGKSWQVKNWENIQTIQFLNSFEGWASQTQDLMPQQGGILKTTDGYLWKYYSVTATDLYRINKFIKFNILSSLDLIALASVQFSESSSGTAVVKSIDGGLTWTYVELPASSPRDICFIDAYYGWAIMQNGNIYATLDGGTTWTPQISGVTTDLYGVSFVDENNGWICGGNSVILRTQNGGLLWETVGIGQIPLDRLIDIEFANDNVGYIAANSPGSGQGRIYKTVNGGGGWTDVTPDGISANFQAGGNEFLQILDEENVILSSGLNPLQDNYLFKSTDGGASWIKIVPPYDYSFGTEWELRDFFAVDQSRIYLLAKGIAYTDNGGVTKIEDEFVIDSPQKGYMLAQNYPNPCLAGRQAFNPATTIEFQIPERGFVTLKIYDILGREIADLIEEEKSAGAFKVRFALNGLPAGIYFYQLKINGFSETKKMIYLK